jgi:hypothetical protein
MNVTDLRKLIRYKRKRKEVLNTLKFNLWSIIKSVYYFHWLQDILFFAVEKDKDVLCDLSEAEYRKIFINGRSKEAIESSYRKAWEAKNFEIELYWKRAAYFWAFQIASFAGYFAVLNSNNYQGQPPKNPEILYFVICIGFITALAWALINKGSKTWQRHWEIHVDMLEDEITGPLYKIVTAQKTFSVSKINDIVSRFIVSIWILLGTKYFLDNLTLNPYNNGGTNWLIVLATSIVLYFTCTMFWGYGRGRFGERVVRFYSRKFKTK